MQTFGRARGDAVQEIEVARPGCSGVAERRHDVHGRRLEADLGAVVAPEGRGEAALDHLDAVELLEEVDVEEGAPELAVGDALEADLLLAAHHLADGVVLDRHARPRP